MNVYAYLRVSGKGQIDGDGFDRQEDTIHAFCKEKGWGVQGRWNEEGVSGTIEAMDRPAFAEMLSHCEDYGVKAIVVERADRLARDLIVSELLLKECKARGLQVFEAASGTELTGDEDPTRTLIRQILGALAQWEKSVIVTKLKKARDRKRRETGRCEGVAPMWETASGTSFLKDILQLRKNHFTWDEVVIRLNQSPDHVGFDYTSEQLRSLFRRWQESLK